MILPSTSLVISNNDIHSSTLTLQQVTLEYTGTYICTAENEGEEINARITFDVFGKVSIYPA